VAATGEPPLGVSVKLEAVRVVASIATENVAVGFTEIAIPVAPLAGVWAVTVGVGATVVNDQLYAEARLVPVDDLIAVLRFAV
jgi:hypothetical protein